MRAIVPGVELGQEICGANLLWISLGARAGSRWAVHEVFALAVVVDSAADDAHGLHECSGASVFRVRPKPQRIWLHKHLRLASK